jgi:CheY-like chemotaxis protein
MDRPKRPGFFACVSISRGAKMSEIRILYIEDNPADIAILRYALDAQGEEYDLEVLKDGEEALRFVREKRAGKQVPKPCVILLDLHLPKYDGLEVLMAIVETPALRHIRVLMTSSQVRPSEADQIVALGAVYRKKPDSVEEYLQFAVEAIALCKESLSAAA